MARPRPATTAITGPRRLGAVRAIVSVVAPPCCAACRSPTDAPGPLCPACVRALPRLDRACPRCALPRHRSRVCPASRAAFDCAWAPYAHAGPARAVVHALKLHGRLPVAGWMAAAMAQCAIPAGESWVVVPVPAMPGRRRRRGFDPAELLARGLAHHTGAEAQAVLRRSGRGPRQAGARRADRRAPGRVQVAAVAEPPAAALLVDDVHTTGATLDACARALKEAGALRVAAVTFARAL